LQDPHDEDIGADSLVENDVRTVFIATQLGAQLLDASSEFGIVGELIEAGAQFIAIASGLFNTESLDGIFRRSGQLLTGQQVQTRIQTRF
jgi:hypothetical protein